MSSHSGWNFTQCVSSWEESISYQDTLSWPRKFKKSAQSLTQDTIKMVYYVMIYVEKNILGIFYHIAPSSSIAQTILKFSRWQICLYFKDQQQEVWIISLEFPLGIFCLLSFEDNFVGPTFVSNWFIVTQAKINSLKRQLFP